MSEIKTNQPSFFDRFKKGMLIAIKSIKFVFHNKKLIVFPLLICSTVISSIGIYEMIYYRLYNQHITSFIPEESPRKDKVRQQNIHMHLEFLLFVSIITFISIFASAFFNIALSYSVSQIFIGTPITLSASLKHSIKKIPTILCWALAAFFIHILINILKNRNKNRNLSISLLTDLLGTVVELTWGIATFLVMPVIAHENINTLQSIKRSAQLMKQTFGENVGASFFLQSLALIIILPLFFAGIGMALAFDYLGLYTYAPTFLIGYTIATFLITAVVLIITATGMTVFKTAVYHYATGTQIGLFSEEEIRSSFVNQTNHLKNV